RRPDPGTAARGVPSDWLSLRRCGRVDLRFPDRGTRFRAKGGPRASSISRRQGYIPAGVAPSVQRMPKPRAARRRSRAGIAVTTLALTLALAAHRPPVPAMADPGTPLVDPTTPILHVVLIMKENRSFDHYFGKFPGANGATTGVLH